MKKLLMLCCALACFSNHFAYADPYTITTTVTNLGTNSYKFEYWVTNHDTTWATPTWPLTGLDGFYVQMPVTATISNITYPDPYTSDAGYWGLDTVNPPYLLGSIPLKSGYEWFGWWGYEPESVYPLGSTAYFSFQANGVSVTESTVGIVTFWGPNDGTATTGINIYTTFQTNLLSPGTLASVPEPTTILLFGTGIAGLAAFGRRKRS